MKLRFKYKKIFHFFYIDDNDPLLKDIIIGVAEKFDFNVNNIEISLNANDYYDSENYGHLRASELQIVNGDIIHVRLNCVYDDITSIVKQEISMKLEDVLNILGITSATSLLFKLCIPINLYMSETGFSTTEEIFNSNFSSKFKNSSSLIRLTYDYNLNTSSIINLTINHFKTHVCIYGSYANSRNIHFYSFKEKDYILQNNPRTGSYKADYIYRNLLEFSVKFKNYIAVPLRIDIHLDNCIPSHVFLQILPYDILHRIFEYLDFSSILILMKTCKRLNEACRFYDKIWMKKLNNLLRNTETDQQDSVMNESEELTLDFYYQRYLSLQKDKKSKRRSDSRLIREVHDFYYV